MGQDLEVGSRSQRVRYWPQGKKNASATFAMLVSACEPGVRQLGSFVVQFDRGAKHAQRWVDVEFVFGEAELLCNCYREGPEGEELVQETNVLFSCLA